MKRPVRNPSTAAAEAVSDPHVLTLTGVRENNLRSLNLSLTHDSLTVVSGLSGSGKTSLAFDTVYAEGGRRYIETFSPYTRQFLDRLHRPDLEAISGVRPALALEQRNRSTSSRSTVGTVTEINDYLKLIWAHHAVLTCPDCEIVVEKRTVANTAPAVEALLADQSGAFGIAFPLNFGGTASASSIAEMLQAQGFLRLVSKSTGEVSRVEELAQRSAKELRSAELQVLVDRLHADSLSIERLQQSVQQAYTFGHGTLTIVALAAEDRAGGEIARFTLGLRCPSCERDFNDPKPSLFSFNSPLGACSACHGFGRVLNIDPDLCVPDQRKSIDEGAVACWSTASTGAELRKLKTFCREEGIDTAIPWSKLKKSERDLLFNGKKGKAKFKGIFGWFEKLQRKRHKMHVRVFLSRYRSEHLCPECHGTRLKPEALLFSIDGKTLPDIWQQPLDRIHTFFEQLAQRAKGDPVSEVAVEEVASRLRYLTQIGLGYLTLDRQSRTLSGGESQRVNLTSILGARLVSSMLVLDEPTIGLHGRDTDRLLDALFELRDRGNTLLVVEHDPEVIAAADEVLDLGPGAGNQGGELVFQGPVSALMKDTRSLTAQYMRAAGGGEWLTKKAPRPKKQLTIHGARAHNLKDVRVSIPLEGFIALTGVSGSGKSTLLTRCLYEPYQKLRQGMPPASLKRDGCVDRLEGLQGIDDIILIDQSPIGKSPRSNPATYTGVWEVIREALAETPQAAQLGLTKSAFSFNVDGGRCSVCKGAGHVRVEMQFLADVFVECEACGGSRFQDKVLGVRYAGKNVLEYLHSSLSEVVELFSALGETDRLNKVVEGLSPLLELGLGYLRLGQPLNNISGGEAQRIKLASYLGPGKADRCLFILDEPTTGLHPHNIADLRRTFSSLIDRGHVVVCIEHNLELISSADWVIDLGPEGGEGGGRVVAEGLPGELATKPERFPESETARLLAQLARGSARRAQRKSARRPQPSRSTAIEVVGARHHNLKNISVQIPREELTVVTGVSGSGKSTLAFDIIFAEGQRRYIDCLSPYARQYITQLSRADVDRVQALPPTIAISQKTAPPLGVSTIATTTELYQYLRLLYSKVGSQHCVHDDTPITSLSAQSLTAALAQRFNGKRIFLFAPVVSGRKGYYNDLFVRALKAEIQKARIDGNIVSLEPDLRLERHKLHWISLLVGSMTVSEGSRELLHEAVEQCLLMGNGALEICESDIHAEPQLFSISRMCPNCGQGYRELDPQDFSFRSARGVCGRCGGRGTVTTRGRQESRCPECEGARIAAIGRHVYLDGKRIHELTALTPLGLRRFLSELRFEPRLTPLVTPILTELIHRLAVLASVGLDYLTLDRDASTISGGEAQRLRLARALGSPLTGVCYVLDEPSIGLHPQDQEQLMSTLHALRDQGNTVIVVEHDEDTIRQADHIVDIGPRGGAEGGRVVVEGTVEQVEANQESLTGMALRERRDRQLEIPAPQRPEAEEWLVLEGAKRNNLRALDVQFPKNRLTVVIGVSGAGKSSLVHGTLVPAIVEEFEGKAERAKFYDKSWDRVSNLEGLDRLLEIDQSPVGKTSSSTPASYLGIFNDIRKIYALLPDAQAQGWTASHFSFNTGNGRCETCQGKGFLKVPMSFLPEATTLCESCNGLRYNDATLELRYQGLSIGELLQKTFAEARAILANHRMICRTLDIVLNLGLGYLTLGQPTHTLSGGEAQRIKIARELGMREATRTLYILDEPTIGLHMVDVDKLLNVLQNLVDRGNTVVVIEHNLDIIRHADHLIEVGPGPGAEGGNLLFSGTPEALCSSAVHTPTKEYLLAQRTQCSAQNGKTNAGRSSPVIERYGITSHL